MGREADMDPSGSGTTGKASASEDPWRDDKGRFLPGHPPLPGSGRPKGFNLRNVIEDELEKEDLIKGSRTLKQRIAAIGLKLAEQAEDGDTRSAEIILKFLVNPIDRDPAAQVNVNVAAIAMGPQAPEAEIVLADQIKTVMATIDKVTNADDEVRELTS